MVNRQRFKDKRQRIPKGKYKMDNLEKLATRRGNKKWTIQRNWQQDEEKQNKNTTQYVFDTTIRKQTQIT